MLGGQNKKMPLGYTIVEVIIVLAISGIMFLIAANFINGKQEHTAFAEGTNDMVDQLQNIIDDVNDGHYSDIPINCAGTSGAVSFPSGTPGAQGSNQSCLFWGKMLSFYGSSKPTTYQLFSLAASRFYANPDGTGIIPAGGTNAVGVIPGLTTTATIPQSLYIPTGKMTVTPTSGATTTAYSIGFVQGLGNTSTVDGATTYGSGVQDVSLVYDSSLTTPSAANYVPTNSSIKPAKSATICLIGGTGVGASSNNDNQLSVSSQQLGTTAC
jgi:prepilin-type N-terminal cleavage/methylation domain-containing protein